MRGRFTGKAIRRVRFFCLLMAALLLSPSALALTNAPLTTGNNRSGMVRVYLSSLGSPTTVQLTLDGSYTVQGGSGKGFSRGSKMTVKMNASTGLITYTCGSGDAVSVGQSFTLRRHESNGENGIRIAQSRMPNNLYPGDVTFTSRSSGSKYKLYVIVTVFMEDYLYGVLPYEMGDASGLEALKAQAVAARTYTMRAMDAAANALYDLVDTTSDQTYNGTPSGDQNCKTAVDKTRGIVLKNGSALTATYYTSTNGGQTESVKNIWGSSAYPYLTVKDDPYDLSNPESKKVSFAVRSQGTQSGTLQKLLDQKAVKTFGSGASVTGVTAVVAHTPKYPSPSRVYTKLDFNVQYTRNGQKGSGKITFDIFSELEGPLGMSINSDKNELWSVSQTSGGFTVTARRYGHGLGMSQRGAMYMAAQGNTYDQILAFYYDGCTRVQYELTRSILGRLDGGNAAQVEVTPVVPAPIEGTAENSAQTDVLLGMARVTTPSGSLNLRSGASERAAILRTIPQNAVIPVYSDDGAWCKTAYEGTNGYVMRSFLTMGGGGAPSYETEMNLSARVTTESGPLNCREAASTNARILISIPRLQTVAVLSRGDTWSKVRFNGTVGYVMNRYLTMAGEPMVEIETPAAPLSETDTMARVTTQSGSLNLRQRKSDSAAILCTIPRGEVIPVLEWGTDWCRTVYLGNAGYVMTKFLTFEWTEAPAAPAEPQAMAPVMQPGVLYARVTTASGSLNLRKRANENADVLCTIPQNELIPLETHGSKWSKTTYRQFSGYVMTKFLTLIGNEAAPVVVVAPSAERSVRVRDGIGSLNLRFGPSLQAGIILEIPENECVWMTQQGDTWCAVTYLGHSGYCMRQYLELND